MYELIDILISCSFSSSLQWPSIKFHPLVESVASEDLVGSDTRSVYIVDLVTHTLSMVAILVMVTMANWICNHIIGYRINSRLSSNIF